MIEHTHQLMNILTTGILMSGFVSLCVWGYMTEKEAK